MPELTVEQITDIISYIEGTESFLNTSVKNRFGEITAFDFATGLLPVGKIASSEEDLLLTDQRVTDLESAKSILKAARDTSSSSSGGDCASIVAALNNLANSLDLSSQFNSLLVSINASLSSLQTAILNAISVVSNNVDTINTNVSTINTRTINMNTTLNTINTNVSTLITTLNAVQTTVGLINTRTITMNTNINTINTNVSSILAWNNTGGILQLIKTCCDNLSTSLNLTSINNKLDTILTWNNTGGVLVGLANNVNTIIGWVNSTGILTLIQNKVNADYDLSVQIKACCDTLSTSSNKDYTPDLTTIKNCCSALTTSVGNNISVSNTINTTIQGWVGAQGVLTLIQNTINQANNCCNTVNGKLDSLNVSVDLSGVYTLLNSIQTTENTQNNILNNIINYVDTVETSLSTVGNTVNNTYSTLTTLEGDVQQLKNDNFPVLSGSIQVADCDVETFTPLNYTGKGFVGVSSQMTQLSVQMNMILEEICQHITTNSGTPINITGNIPTIICNDDGTITDSTIPFTNLPTALTAIGTAIKNTHKDVCNKDEVNCATLYPIDMFAEFNYESQMTIFYKSEDKSYWQIHVPNPKPFVDTDWCAKIHPIIINKGSVYGRIFYANSKVPSSGYFSTEDEAVRVLNLLGALSNDTHTSPRITKNTQPKRVPRDVLIKPYSVKISTISNNQIIDTKCYKAPKGGCT